MRFDQLAKQTHRRGFLVALAALAVPATAGAQQWRCSPPGGGCSLLIPCCGDEVCYRQGINPNSGICGGLAEADEDTGPAFISPTTGGSDSDNEEVAASDSGYLTRDELIATYDRNNDDDLDCEDFESQAEAQAAFDANPNDPFRLDQGGEPGVACEDYQY